MNVGKWPRANEKVFGLDHHVKKSKRGACKHKTATVRRTTI